MDDAHEQLRGLVATLPARAFTAGAELVPAGRVDDGVWWIASGLVRMYSLRDDGQLRIHAFRGEGQWAHASLAGLDTEPCCDGPDLGITALLPTHAVHVPLAQLDAWRAASPRLERAISGELMRWTSRQLRREAALMQASAQERYLDFLREHAAIAGQVPQHQVAAWLGITPVALSRIRARLRRAAPAPAAEAR